MIRNHGLECAVEQRRTMPERFREPRPGAGALLAAPVETVAAEPSNPTPDGALAGTVRVGAGPCVGRFGLRRRRFPAPPRAAGSRVAGITTAAADDSRRRHRRSGAGGGFVAERLEGA